MPQSLLLSFFVHDMLTWLKLIYHIHFLHKAFHSLFAIRNTRQLFSTVIGGHLKQINYPQKNAKKNVAQNKMGKEHVNSMKMEAKQESISLFLDLRNEFVRWLKCFATLACLGVTQKHCRVDCRFRNKFYQVGEFENCHQHALSPHSPLPIVSTSYHLAGLFQLPSISHLIFSSSSPDYTSINSCHSTLISSMSKAIL